MGEVYRATDPELKRDVAVKVLPIALQLIDALEAAHERGSADALQVRCEVSRGADSASRQDRRL